LPWFPDAVTEANPSPKPARLQILAAALLAISLAAGGVIVLDLLFPQWGLGGVARTITEILGVLSLAGSIIAFVVKSTRPARRTMLIAFAAALVVIAAVAAVAYTGRPGPPALWPAFESPSGSPTPLHPPTNAIELRRLGLHEVHSGSVAVGPVALGVAFSPDGKVVATAGQDTLIRLWNTTDGRQVGELAGHEHHVTSVAFNPVTGELASGSQDGTVRFWDVADKRELGLFNAVANGEVLSISFARDGTRMAATTTGGLVHLIDARTRTGVKSLAIPQAWFIDVAYSPDGTKLAATAVIVPEATKHLGYVWDAKTGQLKATLTGHRNYIRGIAFSPDGAQVITAGFDRTVRRYDSATGEPQGRPIVDNNAGTNAVAVSPNGRYFAIADGGGLVLRDGTTGTRIVNDDIFTSEMADVAISSDGTRIAAVSWQGQLAVWTVTQS